MTVEYDGWIAGNDAQRDRLDVLGLDADGRLVVAELKRGPAPDTVEMQAIKYAAMASQFTVETLASAYANYRTKRGVSTSIDNATEELSTHAPGMSDATLSNPRVVVIAQSFSPTVISSVSWLAKRSLTIALTRFQPYQLEDGRVLVTFSRLFPLPTLADSIVAPGTPPADIASEQLPAVEWSTDDLVALDRVTNPTTRAVLDMCSERPESYVSLTEVVEAAGVSRPAARGQLAGLTMVIKSRFNRRNWPFVLRWAADGTQQASYTISSTFLKNIWADDRSWDDGMTAFFGCTWCWSSFRSRSARSSASSESARCARCDDVRLTSSRRKRTRRRCRARCVGSRRGR